MAFSTIQGSGGAPDSFVGTSGVDSITLIDETGNFFLGAQEADDFVGFTATFLDSGIIQGATLKGGQGSDTFADLSTSGTNTTLVATWLNGNSDGDAIGSAAQSIQAITSTISGGQGDDAIFVDNTSNSIVNGNKDDDTITLGNDGNSISLSTIYGGQGDDLITVDAGITNVLNSLISGDDGDDEITLELNSNFTDSTINGGEGDDVISANITEDVTIDGGAGIDEISGGNGDDVLSGGDGVDSIFGNAGDDTIDGGAGEDEIFGGTGDNVITGGAGADRMTAQGTSDNFAYARGLNGTAETGSVSTGAVDRLLGFTAATDSISGFGLAGSAVNYQEIANAGQVQATYAQSLAQANAVFNGTIQYFLSAYGDADDSLTGALFIDINADEIADGAILLGQGDQLLATIAAFSANNILA